MILLQTSATGGVAKQSIALGSTSNLFYAISAYWNPVVPTGDNAADQWEMSMAFGATAHTCIYNTMTSTITAPTGDGTCTVQPVNDGNGNYRMVVTGSNTTSSTTLVAKILPNGNSGGAAYASIYCPQVELGTTTAAVATGCMLTGSQPVTRPAAGNAPYSLFSESTSTFAEALGPSSQRDILTSSAAVTAATLYFPANAVDGTPKTIACDVAITTLTLTPATGWTIRNGPSTCAAGGAFGFMPNLAAKVWYRIQ
jgi:hypothetical protein